MGAGWGGGEIRDPLSRLQPQHFRIIQRPVVAQRRRGFTEGLHGEVALMSDLHGQIAIDDGLADGMAEIGAGGDRDNLVAVEDRLAPEDGERALEGEGAELALGPLGPDAGEGPAADEILLLQRYAKAEAGFIGVVVGS